MSDRFFNQPILNSPYEYPARHWELDDEGQPTQQIIEHRWGAKFITPIPKPRKQKQLQKQIAMVFDEGKGLSTSEQQYDPTGNINLVRSLVDQWRMIPDPNDWQVTPETARLLQHWRQHRFELYCVALKMATGSGKTTVMAMIIAWQTVNAVRYPTSKKFTRGFLVVAPGITIRDRLRVLQPNDPDSYYASRELAPNDLLPELEKAKIVITNYHAFKLRERLSLASATRSLLQGRGEALNTLETEGQMLQRVMPELMAMKNIMALNDEAHHCYREKPGNDEELGVAILIGAALGVALNNIALGVG